MLNFHKDKTFFDKTIKKLKKTLNFQKH